MSQKDLDSAKIEIKTTIDHLNIRGTGSNPKPETAKPEGVIPPSQKPKEMK
jgi:hypothetical protein